MGSTGKWNPRQDLWFQLHRKWSFDCGINAASSWMSFRGSRTMFVEPNKRNDSSPIDEQYLQYPYRIHRTRIHLESIERTQIPSRINRERIHLATSKKSKSLSMKEKSHALASISNKHETHYIPLIHSKASPGGAVTWASSGAGILITTLRNASGKYSEKVLAPFKSGTIAKRTAAITKVTLAA